MKEMPVKVQEASEHEIHSMKKTFPCHIII